MKVRFGHRLKVEGADTAVAAARFFGLSGRGWFLGLTRHENPRWKKGGDA